MKLILCLAFIWVPLIIGLILYIKNKVNTKKEFEAEQEESKELFTIRQTTLTLKELYDEVHRAEFDQFVRWTFRGMLYWEPLEKDIAIDYNRKHMIKITYTDGSYVIVVIDVVNNKPVYTAEDTKEDNDYCADDWIEDNRDFLREKYQNKEDFSLSESDFPQDCIQEIIDRISDTGMFNIFHEKNEVKFFAVE